MNENQNVGEKERFLQKSTAETQTEHAMSHVIDLEDTTSSNIDLNSISQLFVYDEIGNRHPIGTIWSEFKTIIVFVRSFLCFTAKEYVEDLAKIPRETLKEKQIRLVVIGCANWKHIKEFRKLTKFPYFIFCDVDYDIYNRLGFYKNKDFGHISDSVHVKSSNFRGLLSSTYRAIGTQSFDNQGNFDQQGGSLIIGPGPFLSFSHVDKHARDHCPINFLLKKVGINPINFNTRLDVGKM